VSRSWSTSSTRKMSPLRRLRRSTSSSSARTSPAAGRGSSVSRCSACRLGDHGGLRRRLPVRADDGRFCGCRKSDSAVPRR
jgi:hypothetical protein